MKYTGTWSINCGQTYGFGYAGKDKKVVKKVVKAILKGNLTPGDIGNWSVVDQNEGIVDHGQKTKKKG